jgi:undecaprenyl diphosphate synthase
MMKNGVRLRTIGRTSDLPLASRTVLLNTIEKTKNNDKFTLNIALSYGGRAEIVDAVNKMLKEGIKEITEESFRDYLYAGDIPDPAIIIRTGGEMRLSNFLMWESAYSEIYVTDTWWPDFSEEDLIRAFKWYETRDRRFGGIKTT